MHAGEMIMRRDHVVGESVDVKIRHSIALSSRLDLRVKICYSVTLTTVFHGRLTVSDIKFFSIFVYDDLSGKRREKKFNRMPETLECLIN